MGNLNSLNDKCKKDKGFFFFALRRTLLAICVILLFFTVNKREEINENEVINAFKDKKEVICTLQLYLLKVDISLKRIKNFLLVMV